MWPPLSTPGKVVCTATACTLSAYCLHSVCSRHSACTACMPLAACLHATVSMPPTSAFHRFKRIDFPGATDAMRIKAHKWTRKNFKADWLPKKAASKRRRNTEEAGAVTTKTPRESREKPISKDMSVSLYIFMCDEAPTEVEEEVVAVGESCCLLPPTPVASVWTCVSLCH